VLAAPGDRRDEDIQEIARLAAGHFDHFICRADDNRRGRGEDEVPKMLEAQLLASGVRADQIEVICDEQQATERGLAVSEQDDLLLVLADNVKRTWKQIIYFDVEPGEAPTNPAKSSSIALPETEGFEFSENLTIITDERGVRIAREEGD
jgi:cyanophycin synthetase